MPWAAGLLSKVESQKTGFQDGVSLLNYSPSVSLPFSGFHLVNDNLSSRTPSHSSSVHLGFFRHF